MKYLRENFEGILGIEETKKKTKMQPDKKHRSLSGTDNRNNGESSNNNYYAALPITKVLDRQRKHT